MSRLILHASVHFLRFEDLLAVRKSNVNPARRRRLALIQLGSNAAHRITVALQLPNDRIELLGASLRFGSIFRCEYLGAGDAKLHATSGRGELLPVF